jgi:transposase
VPVKTPEQQAQLMQHRVRDLLIRQRTQAINELRSHLAELGIVAAQGYEGLKLLLAIRSVRGLEAGACAPREIPLGDAAIATISMRPQVSVALWKWVPAAACRRRILARDDVSRASVLQNPRCSRPP